MLKNNIICIKLITPSVLVVLLLPTHYYDNQYYDISISDYPTALMIKYLLYIINGMEMLHHTVKA